MQANLQPTETMKRNTLIGVSLPCFLFTLAIALAGRLPAAEGAPTGIIEGRIVNSAKGEYIGNAQIGVEGTAIETFSASDGRYRLTSVPAGAASVRAFFTGLAPQTATVNVSPGQRVQLDIDLAGADRGNVVQLSEFVVSTTRDMDGAAIAINEQRFAPNMKTVVSTDEFGDVAEDSVGEFLKFIPGISIEYSAGTQARGISIHGVPSDYVPITINGFSIASAGDQTNTSKSVQTDMLSITNMSRIEVEYAPTPESRGSALAGTVNMIPRSAFERSRPSFNASAFIMMRANAKDFDKTPGPFDSRSRKVYPGFSFSYVRPVNSRFGFTLSGGYSINGTKEEYVENEWRGVRASTNGGAFPHTTPDQPYLTRNQVRDGTKQVGKHNVGFTADYRLSDRDQLSFVMQYSFVDFLVVNHTLDHRITRVQPGNFSPSHTQSTPGGAEVRLANNIRFRTTETASPNLVWHHSGPVWKAEMGLGASLSKQKRRAVSEGYFTTANARRSGLTIGFDDIFYLRPGTITVTDAAGAPVDPHQLDTYAITEANSNPVRSSNLQRGLYGNIGRDFDWAVPVTLKAGFDFRHDRRDQRAATIPYDFVGADGRGSTNPLTGDDDAAPFLAPIYSERTPAFGYRPIQFINNGVLLDYFYANPNHLELDAEEAYRSTVEGSKQAEELVSAVYLRGDMHLMDRRLKLVGGLRVEQTNIEALGPLDDPTLNYRRDAGGNIILQNGDPVLIVPEDDDLGVAQQTFIERGTRAEKEYLRLFPSLNASFNLRENLIFRTAYYHSIGRPDFDQYAGGIELPDESLPPSSGNRIRVNNAAIKPWTAQSVMARLEYYFKGVGQFSVGAYRREFENFFGDTTVPATPEFLALYALDPTVYGDYDVTTDHNIQSKVRMTGVDVSYKQALTFLPHWARGVQVFANGAMLRAVGDDSANMEGFVPRKASWGISLSREKFSLRVNGSYQGKTRRGAVSLGNSIEPGTFDWLSKRGFVDILGEYYFKERYAFYFNLRNIRNTPEDRAVEGPSTPEHAQLRSREAAGSLWTFGIRGTF